MSPTTVRLKIDSGESEMPEHCDPIGVISVKERPRKSDGANLLNGRWTVTHDVRLIRRDGSVRNFRVYDRPTPKDGDIITLPVDGQLTKARVSTQSEKPELAQAIDAEAVEI